MSNAWKKSAHEDDEVQQLLRAAQDDLLLKLSVDSHMARASSSSSSSSRTSMDPDLERRFEALKSKPKNTSNAAVSTTRTIDDDRNQVKVNITNNIGGFEEDDLFARFAVLKNSTPSHNRKNDIDSVSRKQEEESDDEEDEVEKVIKWAIDAAKLDPSPLSDDESSEEEEEEDHNGDRMDGGKKGKRK